jgi:peptidoglycan-associated lipoprotein
LMSVTIGCAKKEMVRHDEAVTSSAASDSTTSAKAPASEEVASDESVTDAGIGSEPMHDAAALQAWKTNLETVYFDFDSYLLSSESRDRLQRNAQWLRKNPVPNLQIEGHTDERGSDAYNLTLGERRAKSVMNYLVSLGVPAGSLAIISYGEEQPAEHGHGESAWAKNRRVEFSVVER